MYIVYYGKNDSIVVSMAAAIHLSLPKNLHHFYEENKKALGRLLYIGTDDQGNQIFILNVSKAETILLPALQSVFNILQVPLDQLYLADTTDIKNVYLSLGMFLYKQNLFLNKSKQLLATGIDKELDQFNSLVSKTKVISKRKN